MNSESTRIQSQCKKSILCLYTNNEKFKKKIKKTIPRIVVSKTIKKEYSKKAKELYTECYTSCWRKRKTEITRKISCVHRLEDLILLRCQYYTKWSTDLMQSLSKSQWHFCRNRNGNNMFINRRMDYDIYI